MSQATPWALDDLIVCDYAEWTSSLIPNALGLAGVSTRKQGRVGRWPLLSGIERGERKLSLQTTFGHSTAAAREAARLLMLQNLNYESETVRRLIAADGMIYGAAPSHCLLACGPMYVHRDAGVWYVQDLMQREDGTLGGGWWTAPGHGIQIAEAATNKALNPSAEAASNFAAKGAATATRSSTYAYQGGYSYKVVTTALVGDGMTLTLSALANAIHYVTLRTYGAYTTLQLSLDNANWSTPTELGTDGDWYVYGWQFPAVQANGSTTLYIQQSDATARTLYIDAAQVEQSSYPTPYLDGAVGPGCAWNSTAHGSYSTRTAATLKFDNVLSATQGTLALTWTPIADYAAGTRYLFSEGNLKAYYNSTDDKIYFTDGTNTITSDALTFGTMEAQRLAFTWSSNGLKIYIAGALAASVATYTAPTLGTYLYIGSTSASLSQASGWIDDLIVFDSEMTTTTIAQLGNGALGRARWLDVLCEAAQALANSDNGLVATLNIDDDVRWHSRDGDWAAWRVYDDTSTLTVNNAGDDDAYPIFHFTPKTAKSSGGSYSRYAFIVWKATAAATRYPVRITLPDLTGKAQADGDDIRVIVDGTEVDRWLDGNVAAYNVWVNLSFSAAPSSLTLTAQVLNTDAATTLAVTGTTSDWPSTGTVLIESEAFCYTGKTSSTLTGVTRAAKGTSAATHAATTAVYLIQRDIVITYGDGTLTAPTVDDDYKPAFELDHSTNTSWVYESFGDDNGLRAGAWTWRNWWGGAEKYTANQGTSASPWSEAGSVVTAKYHGRGGWDLYNPCGITAVNITNGEYYAQAHLTYAEIKIRSSVDGRNETIEYTLAMTIDAAWHSWNQNETLTTGTKYVWVTTDIDRYTAGYGTEQAWGEFADATATLNSSYTPVITVGGEASSGGALAATITNSTTGESITLALMLQLDTTLTVDTEAKTATLSDGMSRLDALALDAARAEWLKFVAGDNVLTFSDTGTENLEIEIEWTRRYFE